MDASEAGHYWATKLVGKEVTALKDKHYPTILYPNNSKMISLFHAILDNDKERFQIYSSQNHMKEIAMAEDNNGFTCLHLAAMLGCDEIVKQFISEGELQNPNPETKSSDGLTPLKLALRNDHDDVARIIGM